MPSNSALTSAEAKNASTRAWPRIALAAIAVAVGNALVFIRISRIAPPLYGGDEIAYWHGARYLFAGLDCFAGDPK